MIEVEKKFQPTEEQLASLLQDTQFLVEETNSDVMYDYPDFQVDQTTTIRNRNDSYCVNSIHFLVQII